MKVTEIMIDGVEDDSATLCESDDDDDDDDCMCRFISR